MSKPIKPGMSGHRHFDVGTVKNCAQKGWVKLSESADTARLELGFEYDEVLAFLAAEPVRYLSSVQYGNGSCYDSYIYRCCKGNRVDDVFVKLCVDRHGYLFIQRFHLPTR